MRKAAVPPATAAVLLKGSIDFRSQTVELRRLLVISHWGNLSDCRDYSHFLYYDDKTGRYYLQGHWKTGRYGLLRLGNVNQ